MPSTPQPESHLPKSTPPRLATKIYAVLLVLVGLCLLGGGVVLASNGGSLYYLLAGLTVAISGLLVWRGNPRGAGLYTAFVLCTVAWSLYEVGFEAWALVARLAMPLVIGIPFLLFRGSKGFNAKTASAGLVVALVLGAGLHSLQPARVDPVTAAGLASQAPASLPQPMATMTRDDWQQYGNDAGGTRFSPLAQITPENAGKLQVAWTADIGSGPLQTKASLEVTPINVGDAVYMCNAYNVVLSLDAETGAERWRYDMTTDRKPAGKPCRGVSYYQVPGTTGRQRS